MFINLYDLLVLILYMLLIVLVVIFIVLGIKLIKTLKKFDTVLDDVNGKMSKVDGVFDFIDKTTDYASSVGDKIISSVYNFINSLLKKKKGNDLDE